ncbi:unnamed protein product [Darwinula stevensoni]|uniref:Uncharacterized protein n=1 Tax=Darwinula stevensoni TaxID=69355 RepID=A0A7R9AEF6_9CRUS|nr:unnamed protein product [Darwinula stevensoni]CAG0901422.1 unnamed protein product [Darwinula stevensoni]
MIGGADLLDCLARMRGKHFKKDSYEKDLIYHRMTRTSKNLWSPSLRSSGEPHGQKVGSKVTPDPLLFESRYLLNHFT